MMRHVLLVGVLLATVYTAYSIEASNVVCPGGRYECKSGYTCCGHTDGTYGCCPLPEAVCCNDGKHCCPKGLKCNDTKGTCEKAEYVIPWAERKDAEEIQTEANPVVPEPNIVCPGGTAQCPSGNTCCQLGQGKWGCCPLPSAVCCSDKIHCCPNGYTCGSGTCSRDSVTLPWFEKTEAEPLVPEPNIICPGGAAQCPSGSTCCPLATGQWGCCPFPKATCCSDKIHCCQNGYKCNVAQGTCYRGQLSLPWAEKNVAQPIEAEVVVCPDKQSQCPDGNTCCKLGSGQWGCCPLPKAVCCSDGSHCCPNGYTCDVSQGKCQQGDRIITWSEKNVAKPIQPDNGGNICPNSSSVCPSSETCCVMEQGGWGCCPYQNGVCCSDKLHCCPQNTKCQKDNTCVGEAGVMSMIKRTKAEEMKPKKEAIPWITKTLALPPGVNGGDVRCDNTHYCPSGNTCCRLASGQWGCCPQPNAVCCSDHIHCCPSGYTCKTGTGQCTR